MIETLFTPFECKSLKLANRVLMAPMSRYFSPAGIPGDDVAAYYRRRIEGGVAGVITEGVAIDASGSVAADTIPRFYGDAALKGWGKTIESVHAAGGAFIPQLWHVGGCTDFNYPDSPHDPLKSPSGYVGAEIEGGAPMTDEDIADAIASFARGAADAKRIGCDAIEMHGGHGYLFDQFFWDVTNRRSDQYGGSDIADRVRFGVDVVRATREAVGSDYAIVFRLSQWKVYDYEAKIARDPQELERWLAPLADAGVDIFHCSERRFWEPTFAGSDLNLAGWAKKVTGKPTITVGSVALDRDLMADFVDGVSSPTLGKLEELAQRFDRGEFDLVAVGRPLLSDPEWLEKVRAGRLSELKPYSKQALETLY